MLSEITSRSVFTALIAAFFIHNIEEAITICRFQVENPFPFIQPASCNQFVVAVSIVSAAGLSAFIMSVQTKNINVYNFISTGLAAALFFNVLIPHLLVAIYTLHYTPGLVSALLLNLPLSLLVMIKNRPYYTSRNKFLKHISVFLIIGYILFAISMGMAKILV